MEIFILYIINCTHKTRCRIYMITMHEKYANKSCLPKPKFTWISLLRRLGSWYHDQWQADRFNECTIDTLMVELAMDRPAKRAVCRCRLSLRMSNGKWQKRSPSHVHVTPRWLESFSTHYPVTRVVKTLLRNFLDLLKNKKKLKELLSTLFCWPQRRGLLKICCCVLTEKRSYCCRHLIHPTPAVDEANCPGSGKYCRCPQFLPLFSSLFLFSSVNTKRKIDRWGPESLGDNVVSVWPGCVASVYRRHYSCRLLFLSLQAPYWQWRYRICFW